MPIDVNATEKDVADETQDEFSLTGIQEITSIAEESVINDSVAKEDTLELLEDSPSEPVVSSAKDDTLELMMEPAKDKADESLSGLALPELDCTATTGEEVLLPLFVLNFNKIISSIKEISQMTQSFQAPEKT